MKSFLELVEEAKQGEKHHVMTFGRMNPPTTGHLKVIDKVKSVAKTHNASHSVIVSHSQDAKKNPLSGEQKVKHLSRYSPGTHFEKASKEHPSIFHHAEKLHKQGVTHLHVVAGSDRVKEYQHNLSKYNGKPNKEGHVPYHFKKITVHSAGHRDPDAEGSEGMSGTKMREHAKNKNFHEFRKGVPGHVSDKHAKELMHDTRKGMGLHEDIDRGMFRAIFVTGGPGSGKDIIIREAIAEGRIVELNFVQAQDYLSDKQKLSEKTSDFRREALRSRGPLIINGPADDLEKISYIKEELEELGYDTLMIFVDTTNEVSQERNSLLSRMMVESVRQDKWLKAQENTKYFTEAFKNFIAFDNTGTIDTKEEDIHEIYLTTKVFLDSKAINETVEDWLQRNNKLDINKSISSLFKEDKDVKKISRFIQKSAYKAAGPADIPPDNRPNDPNSGDLKWGGNKKAQGSYIFRTYEESKPTLKVSAPPKEPNFQKDNDKEKRLKRGDKSNVSNARVGGPSGLGSTFSTRTSGQGLTGGAGLGDSTYSESIEPGSGPGSMASPRGVSPNPLIEKKPFSGFRKSIKKEAIDSPGEVAMGVGGVSGGATNKEPMGSNKDNLVGIEIKKKNKKGAI